MVVSVGAEFVNLTIADESLTSSLINILLAFCALTVLVGCPTCRNMFLLSSRFSVWRPRVGTGAISKCLSVYVANS